MSRRVATVFPIFFIESRESSLAADGRAWKVDGRAQALVGPGLATPLHCVSLNDNLCTKVATSCKLINFVSIAMWPLVIRIPINAYEDMYPVIKQEAV